MDMERILRRPRLLRSLTSLDLGEFERVAAALDAVLEAQRQEQTFEGQARQRRAGGGSKGKLPGTRAKLFFLLFYFKNYPLQEVMAAFFGLSQGQVSHWVGVLTPLVNRALGRELLLPARGPLDLDGFGAKPRVAFPHRRHRAAHPPAPRQRRPAERLQRQEEGPSQEEPAPEREQAGSLPESNPPRQRAR